MSARNYIYIHIGSETICKRKYDLVLKFHFLYVQNLWSIDPLEFFFNFRMKLLNTGAFEMYLTFQNYTFRSFIFNKYIIRAKKNG